MYPAVKNVEALEEHRLILEFDNGQCRVFDVRPLLSIGRFRNLASPEAFTKVKVVFDTVQWENGLDLDPEYLYERSVPIPCDQPAPWQRTS
jgi:hypothetical protein